MIQDYNTLTTYNKNDIESIWIYQGCLLIIIY